MLFQTLSIVLISIALSALAHVSMKFGMSRPGRQAAIDGTDIAQIIRSVVTNAAVIGGIALYVISVAFWVWVLSKTDVSQAYPLVSLSFLLTTVFAYLFLGDSLGASRIIGTVLVLAGVYLVRAPKNVRQRRRTAIDSTRSYRHHGNANRQFDGAFDAA
jgi:drug/metabolite transporter (DMT)-like permease